MSISSDEQWKAWGKTDPYYGVYTEDRFRLANIDKNKTDFFETGERSVNAFLDRAARYFGSFGIERALDFGCGVGRLSIPLSTRFDRVVGLDISEDMLSEAHKNCEERSITNVEFALSDDTLSNAVGQFDFILSYIVLQHMPVGKGMKIANELLNRLKPGGIVNLHFTTRRLNATFFDKTKYWVKHNQPQLGAAFRFASGKGWSTLAMRMSEYEITDILSIFRDHGMDDVLISDHTQAGYPSYHFVSRKPI